MKSTQHCPRTILSNDEVLTQIRTLLECPDDDLQATLMKELLTGVLKLHDSHLDLLDLKIINRANVAAARSSLSDGRQNHRKSPYLRFERATAALSTRFG